MIAIHVSFQLVKEPIAIIVTDMRKIESMVITIAGPIAILTALTSLVNLAIRSPTLVLS